MYGLLFHAFANIICFVEGVPKNSALSSLFEISWLKLRSFAKSANSCCCYFPMKNKRTVWAYFIFLKVFVDRNHSLDAWINKFTYLSKENAPFIWLCKIANWYTYQSLALLWNVLMVVQFMWNWFNLIFYILNMVLIILSTLLSAGGGCFLVHAWWAEESN